MDHGRKRLRSPFGSYPAVLYIRRRTAAGKNDLHDIIFFRRQTQRNIDGNRHYRRHGRQKEYRQTH